MEEPSKTPKRWHRKLADFIAEKYSPSFTTQKNKLAGQEEKITGLEREVATLMNSNLDLMQATKNLQSETISTQNRAIVKARNEYRKSVITENPKYTILLDDGGTVRYQGKKTIEILGNITTKNISEIFYTQENEDPQKILDTVLDTKGGYLHVKNNGKDFPIDIEVEQFSIRDNRYKDPFIHTTRIDIHKHGWTSELIKNILHKKKDTYQATLIIHANKKDTI